MEEEKVLASSARSTSWTSTCWQVATCHDLSIELRSQTFPCLPPFAYPFLVEHNNNHNPVLAYPNDSCLPFSCRAEDHLSEDHHSRHEKTPCRLQVYLKSLASLSQGTNSLLNLHIVQEKRVDYCNVLYNIVS